MSLKEAHKREEESKSADFGSNSVDSPIKLIKEEDIKKIASLKESISNWLELGQNDPYKIDEQNKFIRRVIYEMLQRDYPFLIVETVKKPDRLSDKLIYLHFLDEEKKLIYKEQKKKEKQELLFEAKGFTNIFELLLKHKNKLVGHNMYFDILFLFSHFIEPLPSNYQDFKKTFNHIFPE